MLQLAPGVLSRAPIPDHETMSMGRNRGPDVLASVTLPDAPGFVEQSDRPIGRDLASKVNATGRDRQRAGDLGDLRGVRQR